MVEMRLANFTDRPLLVLKQHCLCIEPAARANGGPSSQNSPTTLERKEVVQSILLRLEN